MPRLLTQDDLRPLITSPTFYPDLFAVIRDSLLRQREETPGDVTWLAFPTAREGTHINLQLLTTLVEGTSARVFPHRVGEQAKDSMFTLFFDDQDGSLLALMSLDELGPLRTAAPVAFASQLLAPHQTRTLALLGSGLQARYHLLGARHALPALAEVRVYSPTSAHREHFSQEMRAATGLEVHAVESAQSAVAGADVVMVTAASYQPVLSMDWVRPGALLTTITARALPADARAQARIVVPALVGPHHHPSGFDPFPFRLNGGREPSTIAATLVDLLRAQGQARERASDTVVYEQSGTFAWDGAMTRWVYEWAVAHNVGSDFHLSTR